MPKRNKASAAEQQQAPEVRDLQDVVDYFENRVRGLERIIAKQNVELVKILSERFEEIEIHAKKDPVQRAHTMVIARQAKRAGMTITEWWAHCKKIGHDPTKMDRSIKNHDPGAGGKRTPKPRKKRTKKKT